MRNPKILIGGESSGRTRDAFRALGYDAWSCDLLPCEADPTFHIQCDVRDLLHPGMWGGFIVHPDCTYLTNSAAWAYGNGPYHQKVKPGTLVGKARRAAREEALSFVKEMLDAPVEFIALENPVGVISTRIRPADQYIQPFDYGENASKKTGLWLKNLPPLVADPKDHVPGRLVCCGLTLPEGVGRYGCPSCLGQRTPVRRWANQTNSGQNRLSPGADRWKERSRTYQGWSNAMAIQWGAYIFNKINGLA